jgi:hypothetical protein
MLSFSLSYFTLGQNEGGGSGGESSAEASVTTSSSKKSAAAPETIESNPVVNIVKAGLPIQSALSMQVNDIVKVAQAGGSISNLQKVTNQDSKVFTNIIKASRLGISFKGEEIDSLITLVNVSDAELLNLDTKLAKMASNQTKGVSLSEQKTKGVNEVDNLLDKGYSVADISSTSAEDIKKKSDNLDLGKTKGDIETALAEGYNLDEITSKSTDLLKEELTLIEAGLSKDEVTTSPSNGTTSTFLLESISKTENSFLKSAISSVLGDAAYTAPVLQNALTQAVIVADLFLKDVTINSVSDLSTTINTGSLTQTGYNTELVKLLVKYGAIGDKGSSLATEAINGFSTTGTTSTNLSALASTVGYLEFLDTLTGDDSVGGENGVKFKSSVLDVSLDKVSITPGSNVDIASGTTIDVSEKLKKATSHSDRKIYVIGAAKDMTIKGDVTFTNTNDVEDHALVLGAADELYIRSKYSNANGADYSVDATPVNIKYTGSNLGLGSESEMRLVNVNIETGGNLAIGTLNDLHIGFNDGHSSTFSVGNGGKNSDPDNVYLYASNLISVNGLQFSGRVDDIYMDAITIDLKNVSFPEHSDVMLRSQIGSINGGTGSVNFLGNVKHGNDLITGQPQFNGIDGHWDSNKALPNGKAAIKIRSR